MNFHIIDVLNIAVSMFIVMVLGYCLRKKNVIDGQFSKRLSKLVLHVTQPALIVSCMIRMQMTAENTLLLGKVLLISIGVHCFAAVVGYLTMFFMKDGDARKLSEHSIIFTNVLFFGLPLVKQLFGDEAIAMASFYSMIFHIFSWTYGLVILGRGRDDIKLDVKKAILNFGSVPCMIGIALYFLNFTELVKSVKLDSMLIALDYVGGLCTPVSLIVLGGVLATHPPKRLFFDVRVYWVCLVKLVIFPIIVLLIAKMIGLDDGLCMFTMVMAALPTASLTNMFAELHDIQPGYAATCVGMTTAISVLTLPFVAYIGTLIL